jgi:small subunit ribosomal protein S6e
VHEIKEDQAQLFVGAKIGETLDGTLIGLPGRIRITGGSDRAGFPMRGDLPGSVKKYILLGAGPGYRPERRGLRRRKLVRGNTITDDIYQVNAVQVKGDGATAAKTPATT